MAKRARRREPLPLWFTRGALAGLGLTLPLHVFLLWSLWP
ncbi:hypothetical protein SFHH103_01682 [Sinorhizobium fredii HH103]|uniref:Uncharacterized protein n=1 Tax=Sinorhizobium fredii (strain HH103) TaxID=1117943 RepID=G9A7E9_SINF1|nr:hypothetical protein SFHH103_01682 [Sinorhizobium fredii HH103]